MGKKTNRRVEGDINIAMTAEEFTSFIWRSYLVERRYDLLDDVVHKNISVIGTGAHELCRNRKEFTSAMTRESEEWQGSFEIRNQWYQTTELSSSLYLVIGEISAREDCSNEILFDVNFRFSIILEKGESDWKIIHLHQSMPDQNQTQDEFFPHKMVEKSSRQIIYNLRHDVMTGLLNRLYLTDMIDRSMANMPSGSLLMLDVDDFKQINDKYGHPFGDKVLTLLAQSLKAAFAQNIVGRVGGDEFVIYLSGKMARSDIELLIQTFKEDWRDNQRSLELPAPVTVSIGISQCPRDGTTYRAVWKMADKSLYVAKESGKNQIAYQHLNM